LSEPSLYKHCRHAWRRTVPSARRDRRTGLEMPSHKPSMSPRCIRSLHSLGVPARTPHASPPPLRSARYGIDNGQPCQRARCGIRVHFAGPRIFAPGFDLVVVALCQTAHNTTQHEHFVPHLVEHRPSWRVYDPKHRGPHGQAPASVHLAPRLC